MGIEAYNYGLPGNTNLDPNRGRLALAPLDLNGIIGEHAKSDPDTTHLPYSIGDWLTPEPDNSNFCTVKDPNDTVQNLPYEPGVTYPDGGGIDPVPSYSATYHWSNVRFYNTPALPGTQLVADLTLTTVQGLDDGGTEAPCTGTVHVVGLWPLVDCSADPLEDGGLPSPPIDETKCSAEADNAKGRPTGSGISPDLKTRCDPTLKLCVLQSEPK
jgi:hypothetical protein